MNTCLRRTSIAIVASLVLARCASSIAPAPGPALHAVKVNGAELHYFDMGKGTPIIFVHGGLVDYREWLDTIAALGPGYRTVAYSRRYNYPNRNPLPLVRNHSAEIEAEDLRALIERLGIQPVNVVGVSYGGYTALLLAMKHPAMVRSLVLVEPAIFAWLPGIPGGAALLDDFNSKMWIPAADAFRANKPEDALRLTVNYFLGSDDGYAHIPPGFREMLRGNVREWEALTTSSNAFPPVDRESVHRLSLPVLMLSGEKSYAIGKAIDAELEHVLVNVTRVIIPNGTHDMCTEYPAACAAEIRRFLASH